MRDGRFDAVVTEGFTAGGPSIPLDLRAGEYTWSARPWAVAKMANGIPVTAVSAIAGQIRG